jgi:hypothetical protein
MTLSAVYPRASVAIPRHVTFSPFTSCANARGTAVALKVPQSTTEIRGG